MTGAHGRNRFGASAGRELGWLPVSRMGETGAKVGARAVGVAKPAARRVIDWLVSTASTSYHGRWYYSNRWHPNNTLQQRAHDDTVDYIVEHMPDALVRRDANDVLRHASKLAKLDGLYLEFGVRSGQTINLVARANRGRTIWGFDSFEGLPEAWTGWSFDRGAFGGEGLPTVEPNVELVVGWFDDTLPSFLDDHDGVVAFVHIDSDIYSSAKTVLDNLGPQLQAGTVIVFNEYFNYPNWKQHEFRAWQEHCAEHGVEYDYLCWGLYEVAVRITATGRPIA